MGRRSMAACLAAGLAAALIAACGGSPDGPTPVPPVVVPPVPTPINQPPVIDSVTVGTERTEVDTEVAVSAVVRDQETPIDQLAFEWKADAGTFSGTGASVRWRAPKGQPTPHDYPITLTVTETYGTPDSSGVRPTNVVTATSAAIRVHDSPKELGDLSLRFLGDFANSSVPASTCIRDFADSCDGKANEKGDIEENRIKFLIQGSTLNLRGVSVGSSQVTANMNVGCSFASLRLTCLPDDPPSCVVGKVEKVVGDCLLTGRYEQKRWWLCTSSFANGVLLPSMRAFFGSR